MAWLSDFPEQGIKFVFVFIMTCVKTIMSRGNTVSFHFAKLFSVRYKCSFLISTVSYGKVYSFILRVVAGSKE